MKHGRFDEGNSLTDVITNIQTIKSEQGKDSNISAIVHCLVHDRKCDFDKSDTVELRLLKRQWKKLELDDKGLLVRKCGSGHQLVLPYSMRKLVYKYLHVDMGHLDCERVMELARRIVYWPHMEADITSFINERCLCLLEKKPFH